MNERLDILLAVKPADDRRDSLIQLADDAGERPATHDIGNCRII